MVFHLHSVWGKWVHWEPQTDIDSKYNLLNSQIIKIKDIFSFQLKEIK